MGRGGFLSILKKILFLYVKQKKKPPEKNMIFLDGNGKMV